MDARRLVAGTVLAMLGRLVHDLEEFGTVSPDWWLTGLLLPVAASAFYGVRPGRPAAWVLGAWLGLNLVGALLSVLPLPFWPWDPAQTASHYLAHAAYAAGTVPLLWWLLQDRRGRRAATAATVSTPGG